MLCHHNRLCGNLDVEYSEFSLQEMLMSTCCVNREFPASCPAALKCGPPQGHAALQVEAHLISAALEAAFRVDLGAARGRADGWGACLAVRAEGYAVAAGMPFSVRRNPHPSFVDLARSRAHAIG